MNVKEAAARLEVSPSLIYKLLAEGRLNCLRIGQRGRRGKIIFRESDIKEFQRRCQAG